MAPCEWVIDIIKEWVQNQVYATQAWVTAKGYATETWVTAKGYATEAWVEAKGYMTAGFVRRTPAPFWDFTLPNFLADSAWHTLPCATMVPVGAKAILFNQEGRNTSIGKTFYLRYPNDPHWQATPGLHTQVANLTMDYCNVVTCDADRNIQYRLTAGGWTITNLHVLGWWL